MKEDSKEFYARRRRSPNLRKKPKDTISNHTLSKQFDIKTKRMFLMLLLAKTTTLEQLEQYNPEWCAWLDNLFNETQTRLLNKVIYPEDIPFYSSALFEEYEETYKLITLRINPSNINFEKYQPKFVPKEYTLETLDSKTLENISLKGAFYYVLPKEYTWFEFEVKGKDILSNNKINFTKSKAITLPKGVTYFGYLNDKSKPYFLSYFSNEEFEKRSKFNVLDRKRLLENNLRQRGFITNFVEGALFWNLEKINLGKLKRDILVVINGESLFKSFLIKYEKKK